MGYLKTSEKKELMEASARHKQALQKEVKSISHNTERILTNALLIGGALALTFFAVSQFTGGAKRKKSNRKKKHADAAGEMDDLEDIEVATPSLLSQIGDAVITQGTLILLDLAKEKLAEYLHQKKAGDENS